VIRTFPEDPVNESQIKQVALKDWTQSLAFSARVINSKYK
jgi:hypothetical protein